MLDALDALSAALDWTGSEVTGVLAAHLTESEHYATRRRLDLLRGHRVHPYPSPDWPSVPWPPV